MVHLAILSLLVANKVQVGNCGLTTEFVDEFRFPEKHDVLLVLDSLLDLRGKEVTGLPLLNLVELTEGTASKLLDDLVALIENLLSFFHIDCKCFKMFIIF